MPLYFLLYIQYTLLISIFNDYFMPSFMLDLEVFII